MSLHNKLAPLTYTLKESKNLLGFSGGVDSVGLFFLLVELDIPFDIAIVHYHTRQEADDEVAYAKDLAQQHHKHCFIAHAPQFQSNFEAQAREFRFRFFDELMAKHHYQTLLLAHQLNDYVEWFFMQFARGSGLENLLGFDQKRSYPIIRPLESIPKEDIYTFCQTKNLRYFEDSSNQNLHLTRNYFRHQFCNPFVREFAQGIAKSLKYLRQDRISLHSTIKHASFTLPHTQFTIFALDRISVKNDQNLLLLGCDQIAKTLGYVLSAAQRQEIIKSDFSCQIHFLLIANNPRFIFIFALNSRTQGGFTPLPPMDKQFKSLCAKHHIPPKLRKLLWQDFLLLKAKSAQDVNSRNNTDSHTAHSHGKYSESINEFWKKVGNFFNP